MEIISIASIIVGCGAILGFVLYAKGSRTQTTNRPNINIDFDTAKEREDKNRYFS